MSSPLVPTDHAVREVLYEGEIEKRGQVIRNWRARYVVLWRAGPRLQYFARDPAGAWTAKAYIPMNTIEYCVPASGHCVFKLGTTKGIIYFRTKSQSLCETWIRAIQTVVTNVANAAFLSSLASFDGGLATRTRRYSINVAINKLRVTGGMVGSHHAVRSSSVGGDGVPLGLLSGEPAKSHGTLFLKVIRAVDLLGKDRDGTSDPYCRIHYDGYEVVTQTRPSTCNPSWNQEFELPFHRSIVQCILDVYDADLSKDDFLGRVVVPLSHVTTDATTQWFDLGKRSAKSHVRGRVCLELRTDVSLDVGLSALLAQAQALPCFQSFAASTSGVALVPNVGSECASDAVPVRMYPYLPSTPAAEAMHIKGTLIVTNYRLMFVVDGQLGGGDAQDTGYDEDEDATHSTSDAAVAMSSPVSLVGPIVGSAVSLGAPSVRSGEGDGCSEDDVDDEASVGVYGEDIAVVGHTATTTVTSGGGGAGGTPSVSDLLADGSTVETVVVNGKPLDAVAPLSGFQLSLDCLVGAMKYDRLGGITGCGTLDLATSTITSASAFDFTQGQPALYLDSDSFRCPVFVIEADDVFASSGEVAEATKHVNKAVQCARLFDMLSHVVTNRHLEPARYLELVKSSVVGLEPDVSHFHPPKPSSGTSLLHTEFRRQGVPNSHWRFSDANAGYTLCDTYPSVLAVPASTTDDCLRSAAAFRSKARLPALTWLHPANQAAICRCSQPMVGLIGHRNSFDELIVEAIRVLLIVDVRPKINAVANQTQGKGYETVGPGTNYPNARLHFMGVANIHAMRKALDMLKKAAVSAPEQSIVDTDYVGVGAEDDAVVVAATSKAPAPASASTTTTPASGSTWGKLTGLFGSSSRGPAVVSSSAHVPTAEPAGPPAPTPGDASGESLEGTPQTITSLSFGHIGDDSAWHAVVAESAWLNHCAGVLCAASRVSTVVNRDGVSVLVHCSDGWDRTAQVCSLAQLLLDPYFRTLEGFRVLVEKDWVAFGHKFGDRLGFDPAGNHMSQERSPVFVQFLDCVRLVMEQHPRRFEFNEPMLLFLAQHCGSGWYSTFTWNSERERVHGGHTDPRPTVWEAINARGASFVNRAYVPPPTGALFPTRRATSTAYVREWHSESVLVIHHSPRWLSLWKGLLHSWERDVDRLFAAVRGCTCFRHPTGCPRCFAVASTGQGPAQPAIPSARSGRATVAFLSADVPSKPKAGQHGGLTMGMSLGPKGGESHCSLCSVEFLRLVRPRKHCFGCKRSVCKSCSTKVDGLLLPLYGLAPLPADVVRRIRLCRVCHEKRGGKKT